MAKFLFRAFFLCPNIFFLLLSSSHRVGPNPARIKAAQRCLFLPNSWETEFLSRTTERTAPRTARRCSPVASSLSPCSSPSASWPQWSTRWVLGQGMVQVVIVDIVVAVPELISRSIPVISARKSIWKYCVKAFAASLNILLEIQSLKSVFSTLLSCVGWGPAWQGRPGGRRLTPSGRGSQGTQVLKLSKFKMFFPSFC